MNHYFPFDDLTPEMLHHFVEKVLIDKDGKPAIHYRFNLFTEY
ncbi:hypothetical protein [Bacillus sp. FJAT-44742]|nr:hypothetical protein [Bacillus sp. FJAT-44742]